MSSFRIILQLGFFAYLLFPVSGIGQDIMVRSTTGEHLFSPEEFLSRYVQIPSVSGNEQEAGRFLSSLCDKQGLYVHVFTDEVDSYNFAASLYPLEEGRPNIILLNHIDVVPAGDFEGWRFPPFSGEIADGKVWGRGAIDNKAMAVMQIMATLAFLDTLTKRELPYNVTVLAVSGEEVGGDKGARIITSRYMDLLNPAVVFGEGGSGIYELVDAAPEMPVFGIEVIQKRRLYLEIVAQVEASGHGSVPREKYSSKELVRAVNAILDIKPRIMIDPIVDEGLGMVGEHEKFLRRKVMKNLRFYGPLLAPYFRSDPLLASMMTNTIALTHMDNSEGAYNQIPTRARAVFDCRLLPQTSQEEFLEQIIQVIEPYQVSVNVIRTSPQTTASEQGEFYDVLKESVLKTYGQQVEVVPFMFVAVNDNRFFRRNNIPTYGLLPAILTNEQMESIHYFDERMPIGELYKGIDVYMNLLNKLMKLSLPNTADTQKDG